MNALAYLAEAKHFLRAAEKEGEPLNRSLLLSRARNRIQKARDIFELDKRQMRYMGTESFGKYRRKPESTLWRATIETWNGTFWTSLDTYVHRQSAQRAAQRVLARFLETGELPS